MGLGTRGKSGDLETKRLQAPFRIKVSGAVLMPNGTLEVLQRLACEQGQRLGMKCQERHLRHALMMVESTQTRKVRAASEMQRAVPAQINSDTFTSRFSPALVKSN